MADTRTQIQSGLPLVFDFPVQCPAGVKIALGPGGSSGCHCHVEESEILASRDPGTLIHYCLNIEGYKRCPTWQAEKERIAASRRAPLIETPQGVSVEPGRVKVAGA